MPTLDLPDGHLVVTLKATIPVRLQHYPEDVTTLEQAAEYESAALADGQIGEEDILSTAESIETTVEVSQG